MPLAGVALTAIGVAVIRARESRRPDRLYSDPLAQAFVDAARAGFPAQRWEYLEELADQFYEGRTVAVRLVDDRIKEAVAACITQIVMLGAGLDTRAFRMDLPDSVTVFEIDLPELFEFKEPVLAAAEVTPSCRRHVIAADLRSDWTKPLCDSGFRSHIPTLWVDEGALAYLPPEPRDDVVVALTDLSAPGSQFGVSRYAVDADSSPYAGLRSLVGGQASVDVPDDTIRGVCERLDGLGWDTKFRSWNDAVTQFDRVVAVADPEVGHVTAVRRNLAERAH
ncbi:SAM-dependent methyltransferase [Mycolicibacterium neworleansense]|nr:SAM-dependent methyltransferase [Mycolicibacterium neworleansense]